MVISIFTFFKYHIIRIPIIIPKKIEPKICIAISFINNNGLYPDSIKYNFDQDIIIGKNITKVIAFNIVTAKMISVFFPFASNSDIIPMVVAGDVDTAPAANRIAKPMMMFISKTQLLNSF